MLKAEFIPKVYWFQVSRSCTLQLDFVEVSFLGNEGCEEGSDLCAGPGTHVSAVWLEPLGQRPSSHPCEVISNYCGYEDLLSLFSGWFPE